MVGMNIPSFRPRRHIGHDPDYRFTLANERTFLAWIRTALALIAGGLAVFQFIPEFNLRGGREILGAALIVLGTVLAIGSIMRWSSAEEAMRQDQPIPATRLPVVLATGVMVVTVMVALLLVAG